MPGFFLSTSRDALAIIAEVGSDNLFLQYDCYHMQVMEGNLTRTIENNLASIGHIQIADLPGRHEPGTGEIAYPHVLGALDRLGYAGYVGAEYKPRTTTNDGLSWLRAVAPGGEAP
jgi:hydroxypyruvate isomerase